MRNNRAYTTDRGHLLLYIGEPVNVPIVALENYTKWYNIYMVQPDGSVGKIDHGLIMEVLKEQRKSWWVDHYYHPDLLKKLAEKIGGEVCERSQEVAAGRWILEVAQTLL